MEIDGVMLLIEKYYKNIFKLKIRFFQKNIKFSKLNLVYFIIDLKFIILFAKQ